jgi:hypothetical protein
VRPIHIWISVCATATVFDAAATQAAKTPINLRLETMIRTSLLIETKRSGVSQSRFWL